jgi:O-antigen/teichoic acid export membrane protein
VQIQEKKPKGFFLTSLASSGLMVLLCLLFLNADPGNIDGPLAGRMLAGLLLAAYVIIRRLPIKTNVAVIKGWFSFSWPLVIMGASTWVIAYITPYILSHYVLASEVGLYSLVLSLMLGLDFFQNGLAASMYPVIFGERVKRGDITPDEKGYHHMFSMINLLVIGISLLVLPVLVYALVRQEEYHTALIWLPLFAVSYAWRGPFSVGYSVALYNKNTRLLMENGLIAMAIQIALIIWFTEEWGLVGALAGTIAGRMLQSLWLFYRSGARVSIQANPIKMLVSPAIFSIVLIALFIFGTELNPLQSGAIAAACSFVLILVVYRRELPAAINLIRNRIRGDQKSTR